MAKGTEKTDRSLEFMSFTRTGSIHMAIKNSTVRSFPRI